MKKTYFQTVQMYLNRVQSSERSLLVEEIWDCITDAGDGSLPLSDEQRIELDRRIEVYKDEPNVGRTWHEIQGEYCRGGR